MKITKEEFDSLYSDSITKKNFDAIMQKIDKRFGEIVEILIPKMPQRGWYDYGNCSYGRDDESGGYFDKDDYKENIVVGGEYARLPLPYDNCFPTRWLWQDFEEEMKLAVDKYKEEFEKLKIANKQRYIAAKAKKDLLKKQALAKLTEEECRALGFRKPFDHERKQREKEIWH